MKKLISYPSDAIHKNVYARPLLKNIIRLAPDLSEKAQQFWESQEAADWLLSNSYLLPLSPVSQTILAPETKTIYPKDAWEIDESVFKAVHDRFGLTGETFELKGQGILLMNTPYTELYALIEKGVLSSHKVFLLERLETLKQFRDPSELTFYLRFALENYEPFQLEAHIDFLTSRTQAQLTDPAYDFRYSFGNGTPTRYFSPTTETFIPVLSRSASPPKYPSTSILKALDRDTICEYILRMDPSAFSIVETTSLHWNQTTANAIHCSLPNEGVHKTDSRFLIIGIPNIKAPTPVSEK